MQVTFVPTFMPPLRTGEKCRKNAKPKHATLIAHVHEMVDFGAFIYTILDSIKLYILSWSIDWQSRATLVAIPGSCSRLHLTKHIKA